MNIEFPTKITLFYRQNLKNYSNSEKNSISKFNMNKITKQEKCQLLPRKKFQNLQKSRQITGFSRQNPSNSRYFRLENKTREIAGRKFLLIFFLPSRSLAIMLSMFNLSVSATLRPFEVTGESYQEVRQPPVSKIPKEKRGWQRYSRIFQRDNLIILTKWPNQRNR